MKNKITYIIITATLVLSAFFIGKSTTKPETDPLKRTSVSFDEIADVECDGQGNVEIVTSDGNVYTLFVTGEY